jgi:membrane protease YdiL (CAAX protease family)
VILVYIGVVVLAVTGARRAGWIHTSEGLEAPAATAAATASGTGRVPAAKPGEDLATTVALQAADAFAKAVAAGMGILLARRLVVGGLAGWGLNWRSIGRGAKWGAGGYVVIIPLVYLTSAAVNDWLQAHYHRTMSSHATISALETHPSVGLQVALVFFAAVSAPVLEEIFFRGLMQTALIEQGWGLVPRQVAEVGHRPTAGQRWGAIVLTSVVFAAVHGSVEQGVVLFVLSLGLGYVYERTGNLWAPIVLHAVFNGVNLAMVKLGG